MLGKYVRVKIINPIGSKDASGFVYPLNYGRTQGTQETHMVYIMGIHHPVHNFDGRVIGVLTKNGCKPILIAAPKSTRFIVNDIREYIDMEGTFKSYHLECLYESSCGAVVFKTDNNKVQFLLIKNKRSTHWGFPKGHIEHGESKVETAVREVLEETGLHIEVLDDFQSKSNYKIQGKIEKNVTIFIAKAITDEIKIQQEEIDDYTWKEYDKAYSLLKFENDKNILKNAFEYLQNNVLNAHA